MSEKQEVSATDGPDFEMEAEWEVKQNVIIRKLNTKDFWAILKMFVKGGKDAMARLQSLDKEDSQGTMLVILDVGMQYAETELQEFLSSIANMSIEEYQEGDFDLTLTIMEQWIEQEDIPNFFNRAAGLIKKFYQPK